MLAPSIFNAVFELVITRFYDHHPRRALQLEFEFLANAAVILDDMHSLADLEARLCHVASLPRRL
jgi:hypothetical protein